MEKTKKLTLRDYYYERLTRPICPRKEFIKGIALRCGVGEVTVRNWVLYGMRPQNPQHIKMLSEMTGIKEEDLWGK